MPTPPQDSPRTNKDRLVIFATLAIAGLIGWLTLTPVATSAISLSHMDKVYHMVAFAILILPCALLSPRRLPWVLTAAVIYAGGIEMVQPHVGRSGEWLDFVADGVGLGLGILAAWIVGKIKA